jgi:hypothetical protein
MFDHGQSQFSCPDAGIVSQNSEMGGIQFLTTVLDSLHGRIPKLPVTESCESPADFNPVHETISTHINCNAASAIDWVLRNLQLTSTGMRGLLTSVFYPFGRNDHSWPVVQWIEGEDTEALAIFEIDVATNICSWIIHRGFRIDNESAWNQASVMWTVTNIGQLKTLFHAAQHLLGILEWSSADSHKIYCEGNFANCSREEYMSQSSYLWLMLFKCDEVCPTPHASFFEDRTSEPDVRSGRRGVGESQRETRDVFLKDTLLIVVAQQGRYQVWEFSGYIPSRS